MKKQRHHFANKVPLSQSYGFFSSQVWMWELDHKEGWVLKNWGFWIPVLEKTLESPYYPKDILPVNPKGNQHWISSVQLLGHVQLFSISWTAACQASLSITNSWSFLKLMSMESVMPSNHLILCHPLLLPPTIFSNIRVFSKELGSSHQVAKVLELQHQSFQWMFRTDLL